MPRRRQPEAPPLPPEDVVPADLADGPLVGVHGDDHLAAFLGYHRAVAAWRERAGLDVGTARRLLGPARGPRVAEQS